MNLSDHLTLEEMLRSQTASRLGIDNTPSQAALQRMKMLALDLFEPVRALLGVPLQVNSGYRSAVLNARVGGATNSAHLTGDAIDIVPLGMELEEAFNRIRHSALPFDQVITECNSWIHLGHARAGQQPRREALRATGSAGNWQYFRA